MPWTYLHALFSFHTTVAIMVVVAVLLYSFYRFHFSNSFYNYLSSSHNTSGSTHVHTLLECIG